MTYAPLRRVILDPVLPARAKVVWTVLVLQAEESGLLPDSAALAEMCGTDVADVDGGLAHLVREGYALIYHCAGDDRVVLYPAGDAPTSPPAGIVDGPATLVVMHQ